VHVSLGVCALLRYYMCVQPCRWAYIQKVAFTLTSRSNRNFKASQIKTMRASVMLQ
jgi:hypothetical protein